MRRIVQRALVALTAVALARTAVAQALGPQRQFLAIEPYYEHTNFDVGVGFPKENLNGYGGRLWINLDPFHFIQNSSIALYTSYAPKQGAVSGAFTQTSALHFGAEYDQFFLRRPLGGVIDPFFTVGVGRYRLKTESVGSTLTRHYTTLTPGGGIRIPIPNRFELRGDVKDLMIFNTPFGTSGSKRTTNNLLLQAGLGLTF